jgi:transketolase
MSEDLNQLCINTVRLLAADAVQKANSGHPGTPMGIAPMGHVLWTKAMNYNPKNPDWANRDRFILSAGHACMFQYAYLYLIGYDLTLDDIKNFRQLGSKTAGHPEYGLLSGIEVTTGPLGQGFANGVGMAIAQQYLASRYNKEDFDIFDYKIYAVCSDGDLMEGVSAEAASLAGHLKLGNIIYLYDNNHISIEGDTALAFDNEDVAKRFEAYGWHTQSIDDGNDIEAIAGAIENAKNVTDKPSLILVRTHIAYGAPDAVDTAEAHGAPLGEKEVKATKKNLGFDPEKSFYVPDEVLAYYRKEGEKGAGLEKKWNELYQSYKEKYPDLANEYELFSGNKLPQGWQEKLPVFSGDEKEATRTAAGKALNAIADYFPLLIGGAADLAPSTNTLLKKYDSFEGDNHGGRNFHFGVREHGMGSVLNGMAVTKGFTPYGATFLIFSEYMRPPIRLAAIMKIKPIYVYTHDSIGLGEDGTTHQPVEQLISLRSIPNITVIRPADANEAVQAWRVALEHTGGPVALVLTRQKLPIIDQEKHTKASELERGAYVLSDAENPQLVLIATGSEVSLALKAQTMLKQDNINARVVSMPSWELFEKQDDSYKEKVFPKVLRRRLSIEAGSPLGWHKYVTDDGDIIGITKFGESAPGDEVMKEYGFNVDNVVNKAKALLKK